MVNLKMPDFWAKTPQREVPSWSNIHLVLDHLIDVGLVFEGLVDGVWSGIGDYLISPYAGEKKALARRALCVLAAAHDIGKISPGFQKKARELIPRLKQRGFTFHPADQGNHGVTSFDFLLRYFESLPGFDGEDIPLIYAQATACHHGSYIDYNPDFNNPDRWEQAREEHFQKICHIWDIDPDAFPVPSTTPPAQWTVVLAGLISIADWIGSSLDFPLNTPSRNEYVKIRRRQIDEKLRTSGFVTGSKPNRDLSFNSLFSPDDSDSSWVENSTQRDLRELTEDLSGPFIALVESPTGVGKTEAALQVYAKRARCKAQGLYFALPTMATTNAMFPRIHKFLNRLFAGGKTQIRLAQSEARLNPAFGELLAQGVYDSGASSGAATDGAARACEWFNTGSKRGLLAEHAVGTVDQAMMAAMTTKHHFVRLLGLTDKLVVIDEIHSYDSYMNQIIKSLLAWLRALDSPVILLSATLHQAMRRDLIKAYAGEDIAKELPAGPNVTVWSEQGLRTRAIDDLPIRRAGIKLYELSDDSSDTFINGAARLTLDAVNTGGGVACIVNTVDEAQKVFERIDAGLDPNIPRFLVHARFTRKDRNANESRLQRMFGRDGAERPERAVVVATQILEQSLDVDFDTMISDLAPIDLLIQRLGRVHRHLAQRPSDRRPHPLPTLTVLSPSADNNFKPRINIIHIYKAIYLARTALALSRYIDQNRKLSIPGDDGPLLEQVYGDTPIGAADLADRLEQWEQEQFGQDAAERFLADDVTLGAPADTSPDMCAIQNPQDLDEWTPATRLAGDSRNVVILNGAADAAPEKLIEQTARVSHQGLVKVLRQIETPRDWKEHWFLRRCAPLRMEDGACSLDGYTLRYCEKLGLTVSKGQKPNEKDWFS